MARYAAIDQLRRSARDVAWPADDDDAAGAGRADGAAAVTPPAAGRFAGELDDDELALLFAACHPSLPAATQVALALRALTALPLATLAEGLLVAEAALAQRLARARCQLAGVALGLPAGAELPPRREAVLTALALMFRAGMQPQARPIAWEAIRLARALAAHPATAHADADALAALLLLHGARLTGRFDEQGDIVPLPGQPRDRRDAGMLRLGHAHLQAAQRGERLSRWHVQAGIAAEHAGAADYASTDWPAIVRWYELLLRLDPSPAPQLGHAIALAEAGAARAHAGGAGARARTPGRHGHRAPPPGRRGGCGRQCGRRAVAGAPASAAPAAGAARAARRPQRRSTVTGATSTRRFGSRQATRALRSRWLHCTTGWLDPAPRVAMRSGATPSRTR